jgi:hypothetical protein
MVTRCLLAVSIFAVGLTQASAQVLMLPGGSGLGWTPLVGPQSSATVQPQTLHVVLAGDTYNAKFGAGVREDLARLTATLQRSTPDGVRLNFTVIHGAMARRQSILAAISGIRPATDDAILFYWSGHGAYDDTGHFLILPGLETLHRTEVIAAIQAKKPRLAVVVTDCCHEWLNSTLIASHVARYQPEEPTAAKDNSRLFSELLLKARGLVDINGASPGEAAIIGSGGSLFTFVLCGELESHASEPLTWRDFVSLVDSDLRDRFQRVYPNGKSNERTQRVYDRQSVKVWSLPSDSRGYRLGLSVEDNWGDGVRVVQAWPGYPASMLRDIQSGALHSLRPNDVVLAVNRQNVRSSRDFTSAVTTSPQTLQLSVREARTGAVRQFEVTLRY